MGSHRARHRADRKESEELATDLLARLTGDARPRPARSRQSAARPALDPFSTAPFPARTPATSEPGTRANPSDDADGGPGDDASLFWAPEVEGQGPRRGVTDPAAASVPAPRFPADPDAPFPLKDTPVGRADARTNPRADARADTRADGLLDAPRTARDRLAALRRTPIYAAVSATVITATAAMAASAGAGANTPPAPTADRATSPSLAVAALDVLPPAPKAPQQPVVPQPAGGVAVLAPGDAPGAAPGDTPALGATIAARAAADAKAYAAAAAAQARPAAPRLAPNQAPNQVQRPAAKPATAPAATGAGIGARALGLAKGKLGAPYVWGAAGPRAFDCSGLVVWAYQRLGISLPHSSATLSTMGTPMAKAALQPGDLVFFYSPVRHMGIYAGNGMVLNATQSGEPVQYTRLAVLPFHNAVRITK